MSKKCAKCEKTVYPTEELKCLDKTWHKACFRCWKCGMMLNMKNYKGYDKKPYCNAHYPTTSFTAVAETPEMARIAQNTKLQSQVKYHAEYEKMKGTKQSVVDDPELMRHKQNTQTVSNVAYWGLKGKQADQEKNRGLMDKDGLPQTQMRPPGVDKDGLPQTQMRPPGVGHMQQQDTVASPYSSKNQGNQVYSSQGKVEPAEQQGRTRRVGSITDYDPMNNQFGSITGQPSQNRAQPPPQQSNYTGTSYVDEVPIPNSNQHGRQDSYGSSRSSSNGGGPPVGGPPVEPAPVPLVPIGQPLAFTMHQEQPQPHYPPAGPPQEQAPPPPPSNNPLANAVYQAMYDYEAKDYDEVGFTEGDIVIHPEAIDEGWMYGTVKRTGQTGMLPANYVQRIK